MSTHGPLFDEFHRQPTHEHGGAEFDEDFTRDPGARADKHGELFDEGYRKLARVNAHGDFRWDEFDWHPMPAKHGQQFDSDFGQHVALEPGGKHSTWQDVFRGGTNVRYMIDGHDVEGVVITCHPTHAVVQQKYRENQGGAPKPVEIGLGQITEWRWANETGQAKRQRKPVAHPGDTPADVPTDLSSPSLNAGGHGPRVKGPSPGTIAANKTAAADDDVAKALGALHTHSCGCGQPFHLNGGQAHPISHASAGMMVHKPVTRCPGCGVNLHNGRGTLARPMFYKVGKTADDGLDVLKRVAAIAAADDDELIEKAFAELDELEDVEKRNVGRGSATPKSAPIHAGRKTAGAPRHPNGKIDHAAARALLHERSAAFRAGVAAKREHTLPKVNHGGFTCTNCSHHSYRQHPVAAPGGGVNKQVAMRGCASCGTMHPHRVGKTDEPDVDVAKYHLTGAKPSTCMTCGTAMKPKLVSFTHANARGGLKTMQAHQATCTNCGALHQGPYVKHGVGKAEEVEVDVAKSVDTSETALIPQGGGGTVEKVGHRTGCPRGGDGPCGADEAGKCTLCGASVRDHEATGKTPGLLALLADVRKVAGEAA